MRTRDRLTASKVKNAKPRLCLQQLRPDITVHGFRSTFRSWAGGCTMHPRDVCEASLGHSIGNAVEQGWGGGRWSSRASAMHWLRSAGRHSLPRNKPAPIDRVADSEPRGNGKVGPGRSRSPCLIGTIGRCGAPGCVARAFLPNGTDFLGRATEE